ncbi:hypothetical protein BDV98DRAFT_574471 [Pterulicium gracile]|uniref:Uncharacterized protein n=1 Tax=Pterulicium gracile TaxID=1884261 RepID=A0A5C3Q8E1_9AGAR|nr:hypothetical protein BDV98DRAFT_574471 [Pterula gracilis]
MTLFANLPGWDSKFAAENATQTPVMPTKGRNWGATTGFGAPRTTNSANYSPGYFIFDANGASPAKGQLDESRSEQEPLPAPKLKALPPAPPPQSTSTSSAAATSALALESEIAWVHSGGVLRDAHGRRDTARTVQIREQLAREADEKRIIDAWRAYEDDWARLLADSAQNSTQPSSSIQFQDIPWPIAPPLSLPTVPTTPGSKPQKPTTRPVEIPDITLDSVRSFLFSTLALPPSHVYWTQQKGGGTLNERQIVKLSLLRWHPDKLGGVMRRVGLSASEEGDLEVRRVKEGVNAVVECLTHLKEELS